MELNWMIIVIGILIGVIAYLVFKGTKMLKSMKSMEEELSKYKAITHEKGSDMQNNQVIPSVIPKIGSNPQAPINPIPIKNVVPTTSFKPSYPTPIFEANDNEESNDSQSESEYESEKDNDDAPTDTNYIRDENEIEHYGNNKKEMIIPININSLIQKAIEAQMNIESNDYEGNVKMHEINKINEVDEINEQNCIHEIKEENPGQNKINNIEVKSVLTDGQSDTKSISLDNIKSKTLIELKDIAKSLNIRITENGKPKGKEILITEISKVANQNI